MDGQTEVYDTAVSNLQEDIEVGTNSITGELKFIEGGLSPAGPLSGDGNFLALHFDDIPEDATSVKVGLNPSEGTGLVELLGDPDLICVAKIANTATQKFRVEVTRPNEFSVKEWDLSELTVDVE